MNHRKTGRKLGRIKKQRVGLLKSLAGSLVVLEKIKTTEAKAKEIRPLVDRLVYRAGLAHGDNGKKVAVLRYLSKHLPSNAVKKLSGNFVKRFSGRNSGYTRIVKLGQRKTDGAKMAVIEFVD